MALLAAALSGGGCSMTYQLGSLWEKGGDKSDVTGSVTPTPASTARKTGSPADTDLAAASAAATAMLTQGGGDKSSPWENPRTGARGMVTPIASAYTQDGFTCRDFLASYINDGSEAWLQGEACRVHQGQWVVRSLKPWKRV